MAEFRCTKCGNPNTSVSDSRPTGAYRIRRMRRCKCGHRFSTIEIPTEEHALLEIDGDMVGKLRRDAKKVADTIDAIIRRQEDAVKMRMPGNA